MAEHRLCKAGVRGSIPLVSTNPAISDEPSGRDLAAVVDELRAAGCVFAEDEARLLADAAPSHEALVAMIQQRAAGFPVEHIIGRAEFCGVGIVVDPGVFVPRRRSEFLVRTAAALASSGMVVVDLCCGSGALGVALAAIAGPIELHAADNDEAAATCARKNVEPAGGTVHEGDLYDALPPLLRGRVGVLVANAPYVPADEIALLPSEARVHESRAALDGGADGLDIARRVVAGAPSWLAPGGRMLIEASERQAPQLAMAAVHAGLSPSIVDDDELTATVVVATMPS